MTEMHLSTLLPPVPDERQRVAIFALLCLGVVESLSGGAIGVSDSLRLFFHAENCLFVRKQLRDKVADEIMSHGVQLADLFDSLPAEEAQREFQRELALMQAMCLKLLNQQQVAA